MSEIVLYDDQRARLCEPFALTRPTCELRAGALLVRERWEHALGRRSAGFVSSEHLREFDEPWSIGSIRGVIKAGSVIVNSRCAVSLASAPGADAWRCNGRIAAVILPRDVDAAELADGTLALQSLLHGNPAVADLAGRWFDRPWQLIGTLGPMLGEDIPVLAARATRHGAALGHVSGPHEVFAEEGATVEPQVFFDTSAGPVLIRRGAIVQAFTRVVGPTVIGAESQVGGDKIAGCSIGEVCRVHGEVSTTIFLGHANKSHDGFVGHSYLGRWVNLGAGTITSNLKNTYGTVEMWAPPPDGPQETELQFLGTLLGDHAKTGIGTTLTTGTIIGAASNVFGGTMPPKVIPPFAWGDRPPYSTYRVDKFLEVAAKVMQRRHVELSAQQTRQLSAAFERRWSVAEQ